MNYAPPGEQRHSVPKCQACGWVGPWQAEPLLMTHHIVIFLVLLLAFGGGLIYLVIVLIIRSNESSRGKVCPNCGAKNMHTFVYADYPAQMGAPFYAPNPAPMPPSFQAGACPPVAGTMMAPSGAVVGGPGARSASVRVNGAEVSALTLTPGTRYTIGRAPGNSIVVGDSMVSASHAVLEVAADGSLNISDAGSTNGTFVNGQRASSAVTLGPSEVVALGSDATRLTIIWN